MAKGKISPEFLQKIKDKVNIIDIIGQNVVLRKSGSNYSGLCPFHMERSPSFSVSEQKQFYHCFGCKKSGDLITFMMDANSMSFPEAIEEIAELAGVPMPKEWTGAEDSDNPEVAKRRQAAKNLLDTSYKLNRFVAAFYHQTLEHQPHILNYLRQRGVDADLGRAFYVGAAPASWDALSSHLVAKQAPLPIAVELGLIKPSTGGGRPGGPGYFDFFRNRAIFPILDLRGKVVGFGGRGLPLPEGAPDVGDGTPKYLNSNESAIFQKGKLAYGLFQAQKHIREKDEVILVEGYFDVLALHAAGFQNAVATCGTALTPDHLHLFKKFCSRVTVLFDGDRAGVTATDRAMEVGLKQGQVLYGAAMPVDLDPDEILFDQETGLPTPEGKAQMKAILDSAHPLLDRRIEAAAKHAESGAEARTQALKQVAVWLSMYKDPVGKEVRMEDAQKRFGVSRQLLEKAILAGPQDRSSSSSNPPNEIQVPKKVPDKIDLKKPAKHPKISAREVILLGALARGGKFPGLISEASSSLPPNSALSDLFEQPAVQAFAASFYEKFGALKPGSQVDPSTLLTGVEDPQVRAILTEALVSDSDSPDNTNLVEEVRSARDKSILRVWARFSQHIKTELTAAEVKKDAKLHAELMKEYLDAQRRMKEFSNFYDEE